MCKSTATCAILVLIAALAGGCVAQTPQLDRNFGAAVAAARAQQTLHPEAARDRDPVAGVDGVAANAAIDRYHKSYERPPAATNVFSIGVGSTTGAASP